MSRVSPILLAALLVAGCDPQAMNDQPKYEALEPAARFELDQAARHPPANTVPFGAPLQQPRPPVTAELLARGQERFGIFCTPCHGVLGDGQGRVVQRGFPAPPTYHQPRLRNAPDRHLFEVITNGYGLMYAYGPRIPVVDRWAIVAYVRALQLSQWAPADELNLRAELEAVE